MTGDLYRFALRQIIKDQQPSERSWQQLRQRIEISVASAGERASYKAPKKLETFWYRWTALPQVLSAFGLILVFLAYGPANIAPMASKSESKLKTSVQTTQTVSGQVEANIRPSSTEELREYQDLKNRMYYPVYDTANSNLEAVGPIVGPQVVPEPSAVIVAYNPQLQANLALEQIYDRSGPITGDQHRASFLAIQKAFHTTPPVFIMR